MTDRYTNLFSAADRIALAGVQHLHYLEVGTYDGKRAVKLLGRWLARGHQYRASYYGFDLFDQLTPAMSKAELSKSTLPPAQGVVAKGFSALGTRCEAFLHEGNTRQTLGPAVSNLAGEQTPVDLVFLDGGHSPETVRSDWENLQPAIGPSAVVLLDDYYVNKPADGFGCKGLVERLRADPQWTVLLLDPVDRFEHTGLDICVAQVTRTGGAAP